jgi:quinol monooxygenase YgiN
MYVHIVSFKIREGEDVTFLELQKFEEKYTAIPAGLDHFHIFKDRNKEHVYFLVEYWNSKEDRDKLEHSEEHQHFHKMRNFAIEKKFDSYDCDVII